MRILIVDDEPLARDELRFLVSQNPAVTDIQQAATISEALEKMLQQPIDLLFLDIHLMDESGISLAEKIKHFANPPQIVFATAYDEYAVKAFELNATDYILKPFAPERVEAAIEKVNRRLPDTQPETIAIHSDERIYLVKPEEIVVVSVDNNETTVATYTNAYVTHETLSQWEATLPVSQFMRVQRSFLINLEEIKEIQPWFNNTYQLTMTNDAKVPVGRSYLKDFRKRVGI
ncbi:LytTR family transcriptional regulator DNA-binding domain-containing protein [Jeotgalibaca sp. A127]|uniref:LytTR family transcriptional regulator DNA-binding domain-containing protein n=1 Tax=Jeotgalibaca sp. A127 TaxID=3457324 RepID=UPI003FD266FE